MTIKPLADKIVLKKAETEETTASGFILTTASKEKPQMSEVVAVGPGGMVDGVEVAMTVKPGDKVITNQYAGTAVKFGKDEYTIVRMADVLAIIE